MPPQCRVWIGNLGVAWWSGAIEGYTSDICIVIQPVILYTGLIINTGGNPEACDLYKRFNSSLGYPEYIPNKNFEGLV